MPSSEKRRDGAIVFPASAAAPAVAPAPAPQLSSRHCRMLPLIATSLFLLAISYYSSSVSFFHRSTVYEKVQQCAINNLRSDLSFLDSAVPITAEEFVERRDRLARALASSNINAFALEPGYTFQ